MMYVIMKTMCPPGYHHNGFVATHALGHIMYGLYIYGLYIYKYICICVYICVLCIYIMYILYEIYEIPKTKD